MVDPFGGVVWGPTAFADVPAVTLERTGTYTLLVEGAPGASGTTDFSFVIESQGTGVISIPPVTIGTAVSGTLAIPGEIDRYSFRVSAATQLYFDSLSNDWWVDWALTGPRGTEVAGRRFTDSDGPVFVQNQILNLEAGDYTLWVYREPEYQTVDGTYAFKLIDVATATPIVPGAQVNGQLNPANGSQLYRLTAAAGNRFLFDQQSVTGPFPYWRLIDPNGQVVFGPSFFGSDVEPSPLTTTGAYILAIEGHTGSTGTTDFSFTVQPVADDQAALTLNTNTTGSIRIQKEVDRYSFTLASDAKVVFDAQTNNGGFLWSLSGANGTVVSSRSFTASEDGAFLGNPVLDLTAGAYTLSVTGADFVTGNYQFQLLNLADAAVFTPGTAVNGTLSPGNRTNAHRFNVTAGDRFFFDYINAGSFPAPTWRLIDPTGQVVFGPASFDRDVDAMTLALTGSYTLLMEGPISLTGSFSYSFNVRPVVDGQAALTLGAVANGTINSQGETDRFTFTLTDKMQLYFDAQTSIGLTWSLVGPRGVAVTDQSFFNSDSSNFSGPSILDAPAGDYTLSVRSFGTTGAYALRLLDVAPAPLLTPGTIVNGTLSPGNSTNIHRFSVTAGDQFYFDQLSTNGFSTYWRLVDPYGNQVFGQFGPALFFADTGPYQLTKTGIYTLFVEGSLFQSGNIAYSFNVQPVVDETTALTIGTITNGNIAHAGQSDQYTFTLTERKNLLFDGRDTTGQFLWTLTGPRGTEASQQSLGGGRAFWDLPEGDYTITVKGSGSTTGDYTFLLRDIVTAAPLTLGTSVSGTLNPGNVYDQSGRVVANNSLQQDRQITLTANGTYTVLVQGQSGTSPLPYTFNVQSVVDDVAPLIFGAPITAAIAHAGQRDLYTFTLTQPTLISFEATPTNFSLGYTLTNSVGQTFASDPFFSTPLVISLQPGTYT
ncbi:MAG: hypothetical protein ABL983_07400, partial [Nitrospira sp.]